MSLLDLIVIEALLSEYLKQIILQLDFQALFVFIRKLSLRFIVLIALKSEVLKIYVNLM